jgi:hypothetical protein
MVDAEIALAGYSIDMHSFVPKVASARIFRLQGPQQGLQCSKHYLHTVLRELLVAIILDSRKDA